MLNSAISLKQDDYCDNYFWSNDHKFTGKPYENISISVDDYPTDRNDRRAHINCGENEDKSMGDVIIIKCIFTDSFAGQYKGGAISIEQNCEVIITETIFIRCYSVQKGGALYLVKYSLDDDYNKCEDNLLKKSDIQYCCFQDCYTLKKNNLTCGVALYSSAYNTTLLYDSTINCSDTEISDGAQFDLQANYLVAKFLNVTGGKSKSCCGVHVRRADSVLIQYHGMNKMECKWGTMISINSYNNFVLSTCNYVSNKIGKFDDHNDKNGALIFIDNISITIENCYFMNTEYSKDEDKIIEKSYSDQKIQLDNCYIDKEDKNRLQSCETSNCHFDDLFTKYLFDYLILGECGQNSTYTSFFTNSKEFSETNGFSKTNLFSETNDFSYSSKFSSSFKFTKTDDFSKSTYFSSSAQFSETDQFSTSSHFTFSSFFTLSTQFSKSDFFLRTNYFTHSDMFSSSNDFSKTNFFTKSEMFAKTNYFSNSDEFTLSNDFSKTNFFSLSEYFSKTNYFTSSGKFSKSDVFDKTIYFTKSNKFSQSHYFSNSDEFTLSNDFSKTDFFSLSEYFSKTSYFTSSGKFSKSDVFDKTIYFTKSDKFSQSHYFSYSNDFSKSFEFSNSLQFTIIIKQSDKFSKSSPFTNSGKFTKSEFFEQTKQFSFSNFFTDSIYLPNDKTLTSSDEFSKSNKFTVSNSFTGSLILNEEIVVNNSSKKQAKINIGMIIGIVVGVIALLIIILLIVLYINKIKNSKSEDITVLETVSSENVVTFNNPIYDKDDKGDDPFMQDFDEVTQ